MFFFVYDLTIKQMRWISVEHCSA